MTKEKRTNLNKEIKRNIKFICLGAGVRNKRMAEPQRILIWTFTVKIAMSNAFICICLGLMRGKIRPLKCKDC